ncbi:hypothetical protein LCGC14_2880220 [marine sediment metagenome]|uniref:PilZ domain-containing protein n=1 Tax=marine sediment metagenome TaxID=412755 RepID=A0A0F9ARH0_9ZZZZ|nr:PilZ domain-containing protein [Pricia sp.]
MTTKEKREFVRGLIDILAEFIVQGRLYQGQIKNINKGRITIREIIEGGVFIETEMSFSIGQNISMTYQSPSFFGEENRIGKIVWISPQGIGVKFREP